LKKVYILLTRSKTTISKVIALTTKDSYTHASISFSENLFPMYSFSREHIHIPLPANIRIEPLFSGFYKKYDKIPCALYSIDVDDEKYYSAKKFVEEMLENKKTYAYNLIGLLCCRFGFKYDRKNKYFCSEFVSKVLMEKNIVKLPKAPSLIRPNDFTNMEELKCLYEGELYELKQNLYMPQIQLT
jgi:inositol transport system substrate-binding protein